MCIRDRLKNNHLTNNYHNIKNTYELIDKLKVINIEPVSYTHLDVYKRQEKERASKLASIPSKKSTTLFI